MSKRLLLTALVALALTGCATKPPFKPQLAMWYTEVTEAQHHLGCSWTQMPDKYYPVNGKTFTCVGNQWGTVDLMVDPGMKTDDGDYSVGKVRLLWQQWTMPHPARGEDLKDMARFSAYVAYRYLPDSMRRDMVETFLGTKDKTFYSPHFKIAYTAEKQKDMIVHRLELTPREGKRWTTRFIEEIHPNEINEPDPYLNLKTPAAGTQKPVSPTK